MKILCAEYNVAGEVAIVPMGDDVLLRNNDDFYIPAFAGELSCVPQLVVRLCKLGKYVSERFADRYYEEIGVGIRFYADDLERSLLDRGLPAGVASSFGNSAAISNLLPIAECVDTVYKMKVNGETVYCGGKTQQIVSMERLVTLSSEFHTLKIGDFLYGGNTFRYKGLKAGDRLQIEFCGRMLMDFKVK